MKHTAYLGLGSNLNQPLRQIRRACQQLHHHRDCQLIKQAPVYRTKAWGVIDQPDFYNTAVIIKTRLSPLALLQLIKIIEYRVLGRQHDGRWQARNIDIDILLFDKIQMRRPQLQVPHPWMAERCFVLAPLAWLQPPIPIQLKQQIQQHLIRHNCADEVKMV